MNDTIYIKNVTKSFKEVPVLNNISMSVKKGKTIGIVGENGSGKSVLFKVICGLEVPDQGEVWIRGDKLGEKIDFPEGVGVFIDSPGFIDIYSGLKNLQYLARIEGKITDQQVRSTMRKVGLNPDNRTKVRGYSLGMKQKLGIAQAIMENQDILILDEPFNTLDYKTYQDIKAIIKELQKEERTILLTSHHFEDIDELCDEAYLIHEGSLEVLTEEKKELYFRKK